LTTLLGLLCKALDVRTHLALIVKIDIEGAELKALLGLTDLPRGPLLAVLMIELHGSFNKVFVPLIAVLKGFKIRLIDESHVLLVKVVR